MPMEQLMKDVASVLEAVKESHTEQAKLAQDVETIKQTTEQQAKLAKDLEAVKGAQEALSTKVLKIEQANHHQAQGEQAQQYELTKALFASDVYKQALSNNFSMPVTVTLSGVGDATTPVKSKDSHPLAVDGGWVVTPDAPTVVTTLFEVAPLPAGAQSVRVATVKAWNSQAKAIAEGAASPFSTIETESKVFNTVKYSQAINVTKEQLADPKGLEPIIKRKLYNSLMAKIEDDIFNGTGGADNITGLLQAGQFIDPSLTKTDFDNVKTALVTDVVTITRAKAEELGVTPRFVVLNKADEAKIRTARNGDLLKVNDGDLWPGLQVVTSRAMTKGKFMLLDPSQTIIRSVQSFEFEISKNVNDNFLKDIYTLKLSVSLIFQHGNPNNVYVAELKVPSA